MQKRQTIISAVAKGHGDSERLLGTLRKLGMSSENTMGHPCLGYNQSLKGTALAGMAAGHAMTKQQHAARECYQIYSEPNNQLG